MVISQSLNHSGRRPDRSPCTAYGRLLHVVNLLAKNLESLDQAGAEHNSQTNMWKWGLVTFVSNPCLFTIEQCSKRHKNPTHVQLNSDRTERRQSISCRHHHANAGLLGWLGYTIQCWSIGHGLHSASHLTGFVGHLKYSYLPNKRGGSNKRGGWKIWQN